MAADDTTRQLKTQLVEHLAGCIIESLKQQGVTIDDMRGGYGGFYDQITDALETAMIRGDLKL